MNTKQFLHFFYLCLYVLGSIGGLGYTLYNEAYLIAAAIVVVAAMAFPTAKRWWIELNEHP